MEQTYSPITGEEKKEMIADAVANSDRTAIKGLESQIAELQIRVQLLLLLVERVANLERVGVEAMSLSMRLANLESRIDAYNANHKKLGYSGTI